jgi:hypothetical protein
MLNQYIDSRFTAMQKCLQQKKREYLKSNATNFAMEETQKSYLYSDLKKGFLVLHIYYKTTLSYSVPKHKFFNIRVCVPYHGGGRRK